MMPGQQFNAHTVGREKLLIRDDDRPPARQTQMPVRSHRSTGSLATFMMMSLQLFAVQVPSIVHGETGDREKPRVLRGLS